MGFFGGLICGPGMGSLGFVGSSRVSLGVLIFTPIRSFLSLEIRSTPLGVEIVRLTLMLDICRKTIFSIKLITCCHNFNLRVAINRHEMLRRKPSKERCLHPYLFQYHFFDKSKGFD